ncbi:hypothetical protein HYH03_008592 [Edaphochlamys debaryana]|uniref:Protein kinase domain-containing protein n=1 Tax=Edaphochlamys debaryana TaxID=47281 RepID=A0A835Y001_9CHLO|nr:hypothetical protein HYH03_008592 [Edaphochlamys debaryana]|eukprot:KAG2493170.1 hypothetical protein HYH03_008592 [Edaphochlamys debaryana]
MLGQRAVVAVLGLLGLSLLLAQASARTVVPINDTVSGCLGLEGPRADGLSLLGNRDDGNSVWETRGLPAGAISVTSGAVLLSDLTLSSALLAPGRFLVPSVLQLAPGVPLSLLRVRLSLASCHELLGQQQRACGMLPWAAVRVNNGSLAVDGWSGDGVTLRNVTVSCSPTASDPSPPPPCVVLTASTAAELASALYALAGNGTGGGGGAEPPPAYVTLRANISLAPGAGWPLPLGRAPSIPVTRNLTLAGAPAQPAIMKDQDYAINAGALNGTGGPGGNVTVPSPGAVGDGDPGTAAAMPPVAAGWVWPLVAALDWAGRWDVVSVDAPYGVLTITGIVNENLPVGIPGKPFPLSLVAGQHWSVNVSRPRSFWLVDALAVGPPGSFAYWQYWMTLALSPAKDLAEQAKWFLSFFPDTKPSHVGPDRIHYPRLSSVRVQSRRTATTGTPVVYPATAVHSGLSSVLPDRMVPLTDMAGASNCAELAAALGATGDAYKPVVVLTSDITLRDTLEPPPNSSAAPAIVSASSPDALLPYLPNPKYAGAPGCGAAGGWPAGGVRLTRSIAIVGDLGRQLTVLDWGERAGVIYVPRETEALLTIKGVAMGGNALRPRVVQGDGFSTAPMAHELYAIEPISPKVDLVLINVSIVVPAEEVQLVAALAAQQPVPPNTLPPQALAELKAVLQSSRIASGNTSARQLPGGGYDVLLSTMYSIGMTGTAVRLTSDLQASLGPGLGRRASNPFNCRCMLPAVGYLGGPGATPDGLAAAHDPGAGSGFPGWAAVIVAVGGALLLAGLLAAAVLWRRRGRQQGRSLEVEAKWGPALLPRLASGPRSSSEEGHSEAELSAAAALLPGAAWQVARRGSPLEGGGSGGASGGSGGEAAGFPTGGRSGERRMGVESAAAAFLPVVLSGHVSSTAQDSFDQPPSDLAELAKAGLAELPAEAELASMVAEFKEALSGGEELRIAEVLGAGAHGVVYRATWKGLSVAVKTLRFSDRMYGDEALRRAALREAAICCTLHHPNVVTTYTYELKPVRTVALAAPGAGPRAGGSAEAAAGRRGSDGPPGAHSGPGTGALRIVEPDVREWKLFLIQEFCEGGPLRELIDRGVFMWHTDTPLLPKVLHTALEVAAGMAHIHSRNVVHGDLKPDNVLMALNAAPPPAAPGPASMGRAPPPPLVAKVADFGLATKMEAGQTHVSNMCCGTFPYVSPEVLLHGNMTKAADVWSMGLLLWELAHGRPPWRPVNQDRFSPRRQRTRALGSQGAPAVPPSTPTGAHEPPNPQPSTTDSPSPERPQGSTATALAEPNQAEAAKPPSETAVVGPQAKEQVAPTRSQEDRTAAAVGRNSDPPRTPQARSSALSAAAALSSDTLGGGSEPRGSGNGGGQRGGVSREGSKRIPSDGGSGSGSGRLRAEAGKPAGGAAVNEAQGGHAVPSPFQTSAAALLSSSPRNGSSLSGARPPPPAPQPPSADVNTAAPADTAAGEQAAAGADLSPQQPPAVVGTAAPVCAAMAPTSAAAGAVAPGPRAIGGAGEAGAAAAAMALTSPPGLPPGATVDPSRLVWSPQLPPAYVALGRACLDPDPTRRPGFHHIVRKLLVLQKEVNEAEAAGVAAATPSWTAERSDAS